MKPKWDVIGPLYERHKTWLQLAAKIVGNADAEDVVHEAYLRVAGVKEPRDLDALMNRTLRNLALNKLRDRRDIVLDPTTVTGVLDALHPVTIESAMFVADFNDALAMLSSEQAQAFILIQLRGLSQTEAADVLGVNQSTVARNYERGRRNLARELQ